MPQRQNRKKMFKIYDNLNLRLTIIATSITTFSILLNLKIGLTLKMDYLIFTFTFERILKISLVLFLIALVCHLSRFLMFLSFDRYDLSHPILNHWCNVTLIISLLNVIVVVICIIIVLLGNFQEKYPVVSYIVKLIQLVIAGYFLYNFIQYTRNSS